MISDSASSINVTKTLMGCILVSPPVGNDKIDTRKHGVPQYKGYSSDVG